MKILKTTGWAILFVAAALALFWLAGWLFGAWVHLTVCIWMDYGYQAMTCWLIGDALFLGLVLVLLW